MTDGGSGSGVIEDDAALLRATRAGDADAFGHLYERHAGAALVVARQYTDSAPDAEDVVSDAFANVHRALLGGHGPDAAFRAYLFTVVRRVAAVHRTAGRRTEPTDDVATLETASAPVADAEEPTIAGFERSVVARAFRSLPERWREVLWHSEVEGLTPAQIAPLIGLSANSTAALAYRAREGLRQAYLQQHLQDPLDDGCRAVAGRLGAHVRGGLGVRDTRQVEEHLDGCGECRALALELGDVNHGMRAVVAPLVLGLLGLGALAHELPVGGGLAAGAAALGAQGGAGAASGGAGAGGAGAGTGAGGAGATAGTTGAAGTAGAGTAGATGVTGAVGATGAAVVATGASAAAGGATAAGGLAGVLAGVSASTAAMAAAAAAVAVVVVVGATQLLTGPDATVAGPTPEVSGTSQDASPGPTGRATPSARPTAGGSPGATPSPGPSSDEAALEADDEDDLGLAAPRDRAEPGRPGAAVLPGEDRTGAPAPGTTTDPAPGATTEPTTRPTADPTAEPPPPAPADVVVTAPDGGLALTAGVAGQAIELTVSNAGGRPAAGLVADLELPSGVTFEGAELAALGFGFGPADPTAWSCVTADGGQTATCTLSELPAGHDAVLVLRVAVDEAWSSTAGDEAVRVRIAGGDRTWEPAPIRLQVAASPARLTLDGALPDAVQVVAGRSRPLVLAVRNAGGTGVTRTDPALVEVALPDGVNATAAAPWTCSRTADAALACRHAALAPFERSTLALTLSAPSSATPGTGSVRVRLTPSGHRPVESHAVAATLVRPAVLTLEAPGGLDVAAGTPAELGVTVANEGDLAAPGTVLRLAVPAGAAIADVGGEGWACTADGSTATCTGDLAAGAAAGVTAGVTVPAGTVGDLGAATVAVAAPDADVPLAPSTLPVTATAPLLVASDATAVVDAVKGGTLAFVAQVAGARPDGRPAADAAGVVARVTLPPGVTHDPLAVGGQTAGCTAAGSVVTCSLGDLRAGTVLPVQLQVKAAGAVRGSVGVLLAAAGAEPASATTQVVVSSANLTPVWSGVGDLEVTEVGAPLLMCTTPYGQPCSAVRQDRDNNGLDMNPIDRAPPDGPRTAVPVSSQTRLDVPDGRPVVWAGLYWSAVRGPSDSWSAPLDTARLRAPDGTWHPVTGSVVEVQDSSRRQYYQAAADVTDLVAAGGAGAWALADAAVSRTRTDRDPTYYAGWSLVVVHGAVAEAGTAGSSSVTVHQGGAWIGASASAPAFAFVGEAGARTRIGVVAWEGDRATSNDRLTLSGVGALRPLRWDGDAVVGGGSSSNAFDSTATGWAYPNALGVDAKGFEEVTLPSGVGTLTPTTAGDQYLIGVVTVRTVAPASLLTPPLPPSGS